MAVGAFAGAVLAIIVILIGGVHNAFTIGAYSASTTTVEILIRVIPITIFLGALAYGALEACRSIWKSLTKNLAQQLGKE